MAEEKSQQEFEFEKTETGFEFKEEEYVKSDTEEQSSTRSQSQADNAEMLKSLGKAVAHIDPVEAMQQTKELMEQADKFTSEISEITKMIEKMQPTLDRYLKMTED